MSGPREQVSCFSFPFSFRNCGSSLPSKDPWSLPLGAISSPHPLPLGFQLSKGLLSHRGVCLQYVLTGCLVVGEPVKSCVATQKAVGANHEKQSKVSRLSTLLPNDIPAPEKNLCGISHIVTLRRSPEWPYPTPYPPLHVLKC